jgi:formin-binding protein 1
VQVREIYQNRIALEREYSGKLLLLANKATEKKTKKIAALVLGEEPTKTWGEGDVKTR